MSKEWESEFPSSTLCLATYEHPGRPVPAMEYLLRGRLRRLAGSLDLALADLGTARDLAPGDAAVTFELAAALEALGRIEGEDGAIALYRSALARDARNGVALVRLAFLADDWLDVREALPLLDAALEAQPENASLYVRRVRARAARGELSGAQEDIRTLEALAEGGLRTDVHRANGVFYLEMGSFGSAVQHLNFVLEGMERNIPPDEEGRYHHSWSLYHRARACRALANEIAGLRERTAESRAESHHYFLLAARDAVQAIRVDPKRAHGLELAAELLREANDPALWQDLAQLGEELALRGAPQAEAVRRVLRDR